MKRIEELALDMIPDGVVMGLGSGRAATAFVRALGQRVQQGFRVRGVPTSQNTAQVATECGIPLTTLDDVAELALTVDGADEVDPALNLIKGLGGALVREKFVATASRKLVILVGPEKLSPVLGSRGVLPVEIVPFALGPCRRRLAELGMPGQLRQKDGATFITDNHNYILDCRVGPLADPAGLQQTLAAIPGVVGTGLFIGMADVVLIQHADRAEERVRTPARQ